MKLDFSALAQPAANARGQMGTTGTPAFTRVCVSPPTQPGAGTTGDKTAALVLVADLVAAVPAACPPVSPTCSQAVNAEKPNAGAVSPVSPHVPTETAQVAVAPFVREDLDGKTRAGANINTCTDCLHLLRRGTCGVPMAAGLLTPADGFGIVWPPEGHGAACPAYAGKAPRAAADRPHRLTNEEADRCHAPCWDDDEIAAFTLRAERFTVLGRADADDLAARLTLRDRDGDDRHMCRECRELAQAGRCSAAARGDMPGVGRQMEPVPDILMRCASFKPAVSAHRDSQGTEDASHHD